MAPANAGEFNSNFYFDPQTGTYMLRGTLDIVVASGGVLKVDGVDVSAGLEELANIGGLSAAEVALIDSVTAGTTAAGKAVTLDANSVADVLAVGTERKRVWNATGAPITKGKLVAFNGVHTNGLPKIVLADANNGLIAGGAAQADIADAAAGFVVTRGLSPATLDTSGAGSAGDPGYVSETAGDISWSEEVEGDEFSQVAGWAVTKHATTGQMLYNFGDAKAIGHGQIQADAVRASELGVTAGTAIAERALVPDANLDLTGLRNLTLTGALAGVTDLTTTGNTVLGNAAGDTVKFHGTAGSGAQSAFIADLDAFTDPPSAAEMALLRTLVNGLKATQVNHGLMAAS